MTIKNFPKLIHAIAQKDTDGVPYLSVLDDGIEDESVEDGQTVATYQLVEVGTARITRVLTSDMKPPKRRKKSTES